MLKNTYRLRDSARIAHIKRTGKSWHNRLLVLVALPSDGETSRFAISVSRRVGRAVVRNRVKRRIRETIRHCIAYIPAGWDLLVIARVPSRDATYVQIQSALQDLLARAGLTRRVRRRA